MSLTLTRLLCAVCSDHLSMEAADCCGRCQRVVCRACCQLRGRCHESVLCAQCLGRPQPTGFRATPLYRAWVRLLTA